MENSNTGARAHGFSGKIGFVMAAAGSAVGLGNLWRFPYLAAENGGGIFLLVYLILSISLGFIILITEIAIGRRTGKSAIDAFRALDKRFSFLGYLATLSPLLVLPYYSVIGGWVMKYAFSFIVGDGSMTNDGYYTDFISRVEEPLLWFAIFVVITTFVVMLGVKAGIEGVSSAIMPMLILLILFIAIYGIATIDGAVEGVIFYIRPDFSKFSVHTVIAALGQLFYSMTLASGVMVTFGSYMKKDISIMSSAHQIELFDTGIAFLAGLMIIPAVYAFTDGEIGYGPGLIFEALPKIFNSIPFSRLIGAAFFVMVLFAALTSAIALMETVVAAVMDKLKLRRSVACLSVMTVILILGLFCSFGYSLWSNFRIIGLTVLEFFDFLSNNIIMPVLAVLTCVLVGYIVKAKTVTDELNIGGKFRAVRLYSATIRYIAPLSILVIFVSSIAEAFG